MLVSDCCNAPLLGSETDQICSACKEHCGVWDDEEEEE